MSSDGYVTDWAHVRRAVGASATAGALFGAVYGVARGRGGQGAFVAAVQAAGFSGSFFVVREGFRHAARVSDWRQDWVALNGLSCATGSAVVGSLRRSWNGKAFVRFFVTGAAVGVLGSLAYVWVDETLRRWRRRQQESGGPASEWTWLPSWAPIHRLTEDELKQRQFEIQQQQKR